MATKRNRSGIPAKQRKCVALAVALALCFLVTTGAWAQAPELSDATAFSLESKSLDSLAKRIVSEYTHPGMTQFEKAVALYDYLIDHTVYRGGITDAYHVLRKGEASCGGYAGAYVVLLKKAGIQSKSMFGRAYTQDHVWNAVKLSGKWYHVDVRIGSHFAASEGRYRRFGMSDEQAKVYYKFKSVGAKSYLSNYAYKTGTLDRAIAYVRSAITAKVEAGEKLFIINMMSKDAPSELTDPFNRITVKNALKGLTYALPGIPDSATLTLSLSGEQLLVAVNAPKYRVKELSRTREKEIVIEVDGDNFSAVPPLEMREMVMISPSYATNQTLYWMSYREKTARIDQSGRVTIVGFGKAKIRATAVDGSKRTLTYHVVVKQK